MKAIELFAGAGGLGMGVSKAGFDPVRKEAAVQAGHVTELHFELAAAEPTVGAIAGHVVDGEGHPIASALVEVIDGPTRRNVRTNEQGLYRLAELLPGDYVVRAGKDGFESMRREAAVVAGETTELHFELARVLPTQGALRGLVSDGEEHAIAEVTVEILEGPHTATNREGRYEIGHLDPGVYTVRFTRNGFQTLTREKVNIIAGETTTLNVTLVR